MRPERQWIVITHAGEWEPEVVHGPFETVQDAAIMVGMRYTATLLPLVDGVRSCVEDSAASELFRRIRSPRTMPQIIDRATQ